MGDCRIGKELKQSTCRYVKKCPPGWSRNEKFICRKTTRRLQDNANSNVVHFENQNSIASPNLENNDYKHVYEDLHKPKRGSVKSRKTKQVGNYIMYTHTDGRRARAKIMSIRDDGAYELYIPSLLDELGGTIFKIMKPTSPIVKSRKPSKSKKTKRLVIM